MHVSYSVSAEEDLRLLGIHEEYITALLKYNATELVSTIQGGRTGIMAGEQFSVVFHRMTGSPDYFVVDALVPNHSILRYS